MPQKEYTEDGNSYKINLLSRLSQAEMLVHQKASAKVIVFERHLLAIGSWGISVFPEPVSMISLGVVVKKVNNRRQ